MEEKFNEKKKSNVLGFILIFILGAAVGAGCLFGYNKFLVKDANVADESKNQSTEKSEKSKEEDSTTKASTIDNFIVNGVTYNLTHSDNWFSYVIDGSDFKKFTLNIKCDQFMKFFNNPGYGINFGNKTSIPINMEFDKPLKYVGYHGFGQGYSGKECIFFLFQDGTLRYLVLDEVLKSNEFKNGYTTFPTPKVFEGVDNVDYLSDVYDVPSSQYDVGGAFETAAVKKDGTYVLLYKTMGAY